MIIAHYAHRLPADYDIGKIRARAASRGPLWDAAPHLVFKAFILREAGQRSALANDYSSLYLWQTEEGFRDFLINGKYEAVTTLFGRAEIQTSVVLEARRGTEEDARFLYKEECEIPVDADVTAHIRAEIDRNRDISQRKGIATSIVAIDTQRWRTIHVVLSSSDMFASGRGVSYEIVHLAKPLLGHLPPSGAQKDGFS